MKKTEHPLLDKSTEEKIKVTAEKLFMEQGFSATRTRDIAEAAGINLALLNYYYRSKKNLFDVIKWFKLIIAINVKSFSYFSKYDYICLIIKRI